MAAPAAGDDATPSMIRAFVKLGSPFRRTEEISAARLGTGPPSLINEVAQQEFKLYIWPTTTMRTICAQIHAAAPIASPFARHSIRVVFFDSKLGAYRARDYLHGVTRVSQTGLMQLLGGDDVAKEIVSAALPQFRRNRDRNHGDADGKAGDDGATGEEEGVINSARTIESLSLRGGDSLDILIHVPGSGGIGRSGQVLGLNERRSIHESHFGPIAKTGTSGGWGGSGRDLPPISMSATRGARGIDSGGWGRNDSSMERSRSAWGGESREDRYGRSNPPHRGGDSAGHFDSGDRRRQPERRDDWAERDNGRVIDRRDDDRRRAPSRPFSRSSSRSRSPPPRRRSISRSPSRRRSRSRSRSRGWSP